MVTPPSKQLLVDVRSPAEFATGALANDLYTAVNIEYTAIDQLPEIYQARGVKVDKDDHLTLYCRSGRRSDIALQILKEMGYRQVRDIGGFEDARALLQKEEMERAAGLAEEASVMSKKDDDEKRTERLNNFGALLEGLKGLE